MRLASIVSGLSAISGVLATAIEPEDFNVTNALQNLGVDVTKIPALASGIQSRSIELGCSTAVRQLQLELFQTGMWCHQFDLTDHK